MHEWTEFICKLYNVYVACENDILLKCFTYFFYIPPAQACSATVCHLIRFSPVFEQSQPMHSKAK